MSTTSAAYRFAVMRARRTTQLLCIWLGCGLLTSVLQAAETPDYVRDIEPIFQKHCVACHQVDEAESDFALDRFESLLAGGKSGVALTAGAAASSRLWLMMSGALEPKMPPEDSSIVSEAELELVQRWIDQGAPGPKAAPGTSGQASDDAAKSPMLRVPDLPVTGIAAGPVTAVAVSSDGTWRATGRFETIQWETTSGQDVSSLKVEHESVHCLQFSRDGKRLFAATGTPGLQGRVVVLEVPSGKIVQQVKAHSDAILAIAVSPDGSQFATGGYDRKIAIWQLDQPEPVRVIQGHTAAIRALAFSPSGQELISGSDDQTVKVWSVSTGQRLDTMGQATGSVTAVGVTGDGRSIFAGSSDKRLRVWQFESKGKVAINPLILTRFIDETPITRIALSADDRRLIALTAAGNLKLLSTADWSASDTGTAVIPEATDLAISPTGTEAWIGRFNGEVTKLDLPKESISTPAASLNETSPLYLDLAPLTPLEESKLTPVQPLANQSPAYALPRGAEVSGSIQQPGESDWYTFHAHAGEMWVVETDTRGLNSRLDTLIEIRSHDRSELTQVRLQAVRDSYFTFRGKNSLQNDDFRVFAWEEMQLNDYLYASGEVTKLWMAPRGADSGFLVYPGRGNRWTYFGTSGVTHALSEPAYIVRPLAANETPIDNGLPIFDLPYLNDDEPTQTRARDSYLLFKAPATGDYCVSVRDTRGQGGERHAYKLRVRPATPGFVATTQAIKQPIQRGTGRELLIEVQRQDGYDGEVWIDLTGELPPGLSSNFPVRIQPGQSFAIGNVWASGDAPDLTGEPEVKLVAHAIVNGRRFERPAGSTGKLTLADRANALISLHRDNNPLTEYDVVTIRRGSTIALQVRLDRKSGFNREVPLGKEMAGRNLPHGVYVDNIGLNGLLVRENESERSCFITAAPTAELGQRSFFFTAEIDGNVTSPCYQIEVVE